MQTFIAIEEARELVLGAVSVGACEVVALADLLGRTLADATVSDKTLPPFASSGMDGFAVRAGDLADLPTVLEVIEDLPAGAVPQRSVEAGTCARIMTGALFPEGADAVVPVEWTEPAGAGRVRIERAPEAGQFVRPVGQDLASGDQVFEAGQVVTPPVLGMLASLGIARLPVRIAPSVAIITTGDELVPADSVLGPGQIHDSNGPALAGQVTASGGRTLGPLHAEDSAESTRQAIVSARDADLIVFAGGVSMGERDVVRSVLDEAGWTPIFWKVRQRPGKPLAFGLLDGRPVFGLPGNPVSSSVCFEQYVRPVLAKMLGREGRSGRISTAILAVSIEKAAGLHHLLRGIADETEDGRLRVRPTGLQGSNLYSSMAKADGFIHLPEAIENPPAGSEVAFEWLPWMR